MRLTALLFILTTLLSLNSNPLFAQCTITSCPNPAIISGNIAWTDGVQGTSNGFLSITGITLGNIDCAPPLDENDLETGDAGIEIYVYQLLPDGTRMSFCNELNPSPDNFIFKYPLGLGPISDCSNTAFPFQDLVIYDHENDIGTDSNMYLCEGGVYEVVITLYVKDAQIVIGGEESVFSALNANQYVELSLGTFFVNYTNEFATPNPYPIPISTAVITGPNGETGSIETSCNEDINLFVEALSYIGRCRVNTEPVPNFYTFCDPLDPNMTNGTYSPSIESELENFLSYTINGGPPVIIRDGNSGNPATAAYGGQQTGPDNLPGLVGCYTGICGARPFPVPDSMCAGDVMVVTLETFDVYTNTTVSDQMTVTFTGEGCNDCGPACPATANISASGDQACGGDMITITGSVTGEGGANFEITESTGTITGISEGTAFNLPFNTTCQPITYTFNATVTCVDDGSTVPGGTLSLDVVVYPTSIADFITANDGDCSTSIVVDSSCGTNINVSPGESQAADPNTSGTHNYTISWLGGGPGCINDFDVTANYDCPPDIVCPTSANISASTDEACGGDMITITGSSTGEGGANFEITESTGTITSISEGTAFNLPSNTTCQPITYTFNATATCIDDGSTVPGGLSVDVVVYPTSIVDFVTANDGDCSTSIVVDSSCGTNVSVSPDESQTADAGTSGTHNYTISWLGGGLGCINDFDVTANYDCPSNCPDEANITATTNSVCGGDMVTITTETVGNGSASFEITEATGAVTGIVAGSAFTIPDNTTCQPITYTFNATATCDDDGSAIATGVLSLDIIAYPNDISSLITTVEDGCTTEVIIDDSCAGNVMIEPSSSQTAELGDDEGIHDYTISWTGDDFGCISSQSISLNYNCPCEFDPALAGVEKVGGNEPLNKICFGDSLNYNAIYDNLIINLDDGGIDVDYSASFVIFIEPIDFAVPPTSDQIQRITNDTFLVNDGSIPPGRYYIYYFQSESVLDPVTDTGDCTLISGEYCEIAILEDLTVESTTCSGFENNNEIIITVTGGDTHDPPSSVYLDSNGMQINPTSIETTMDTVRIITFSNLPDGDYMFFYEDASACKESLLLEFSCSSSEFDCPSEVVTTNFEACAGEVTSLDANIVGESEFTTISWFDSEGNLISDPNTVQLPSNDGCAPINIDYTIEVSCTQNPDFVTLTDIISITVYPTDVSAFVTPVESQCEAMLAIDESCGDLVTFNPVSFNPGESGTVDLTVNYSNNCVSSFTVSVNYNCAAIMGCTDPCASNFDPLAMENDGSCEPYDDTCNQDCGQGPFAGIWDTNTCSCIDEIVPVNGCMDMNACNFDASANCDDGSCDNGNTACPDPCNEPNPDDGCDITTDSFDEATCTVTNEPDCPANTTFNANTCNCDTDIIFGCMDICAPNFNSLANEDDGSCEPYDNTCNDDCTLGPFGGTWDPVLCDCIEEIDNINGCIDINACNYNAMATCDDDSCDYGNDACADPCNEPNPDDGCELTTDSFNAATCTVTNTPNCATDETFNPTNCECVTVAVDGCTDPCDPAYDPASTNDVLCIGYTTECNADCTLGTFGGIWDQVTCACINEITPVSGCTDVTACNYDVTANCNDDSCVYGNVACPDPCNEPNPDDGCDITTDSFDEATCTVTNEPDCPANTTFNSSTCNCDTDVIPGCTDACAPNFNPLANQDDGTCARYDRTCNEDCKIGPFGGTYDDATCGCINEITPVNGCTDSTACNYNASANCNDDSCVYGNLACADPCNEPNPDDGCDITIDSFDTATCIVTNEPDCPANTTFNASTCNCDTDVIPGCTDPCAPNFNPLANQDDGSCGRYDGNCNDDCTAGPFGGTWDPMLCECINEIDPVNGCTDITACNYDASANCSDDRCIYGNLACADPCNEPNPDDGCDITTDSFDAATCAVINEPDCPANTVFNANTCNCDMDMIPGCTDSCAPNFNPDANFDDDSCESYDATCNEDCTTGPFGGAWDTSTCSCINEIAPVNGCTDATACNYDATANCDDISCLYGNDACADPCFEPNIDDGCDITIDSFDAATCTVINEPDCPANTEFEPATCECLVIDIDGCTDPCDPNYNPLSVNDVLCKGYNNDCNTDCNAGPFGGNWDENTCSCINEITPVYGCTDSTDPNYNPAANCDDGSCSSVMCNDPCAPNFGAQEACESYITTCNDDCTTGPYGGTWDASTCSCINEITPINGCIDVTACNYNASANCDDDSCEYGNDTCSDPCNEPNPDDGCDLTTDSFDAATCTVINEPNCPTGRAFNTSTCNCDERIDCVPPATGIFECED